MLGRAKLLVPLALVFTVACNGGFLGDGESEGEGESGEGEGFGDEAGEAGDDGTSFNEYCAAQADWDPDWAAFEDEVLALANEFRAQGASCGGEEFGPTGPMVAEAQLRCAARLHSQDMAVREFFSHTNPDGESPWDRVDRTDYTGFASGENIASGHGSPSAVMDAWMSSPGHCANIMNPDNNELGVGFYGEGNLWTQVMGQR